MSENVTPNDDLGPDFSRLYQEPSSPDTGVWLDRINEPFVMPLMPMIQNPVQMPPIPEGLDPAELPVTPSAKSEVAITAILAVAGIGVGSVVQNIIKQNIITTTKFGKFKVAVGAAVLASVVSQICEDQLRVKLENIRDGLSMVFAANDEVQEELNA